MACIPSAYEGVVLNQDIKDLPETVVFLLRSNERYDPRRSWGDFDSLTLRALDDLSFEENATDRAIYGFTEEPPHDGTAVAVALPLQVALERVFFHVAGNCSLVLNASEMSKDRSAVAQRDIDFSLPSDFSAQREILSQEIPDILGALAVGDRKQRDLISEADKALRKGSFFESYVIAQRARIEGVDIDAAWFYELFAYSFFGDPEQALRFYEQYPSRGDSAPLAQLLAARYRLLLRQFNECRTILHTISFPQEYEPLASMELARSYALGGDYQRALEHSEHALEKDRALTEAYLVRGIAYRGLFYESGESEGLAKANRDFERVAQQGSYSSAEALYHAGTVCARLGLLDEAERAFRHSLFQRNKISPRDALIRVLVAREKAVEAVEELEILTQLDSAHGELVRRDLDLCAEESTESAADFVQDSVSLDDSERAKSQLRQWSIPIQGDYSDFALLDDFINYFAPDGDFPKSGEFSELSTVSHQNVARTLALHLGALLVEKNRGVWEIDSDKRLCVRSKSDDVVLPLESFVYERVLLGASGDNFSALESLVIDDKDRDPLQLRRLQSWWQVASETDIAGYEGEISWFTENFKTMGIELRGDLTDFEKLDRWIDETIEPGGTVKSEDGQSVVVEDMPRFVSALGLFLGRIVASMTTATWFSHPKGEGISLLHRDLGRVFPIARAQRRFFLASAADFSLRFSSFAWSIGVASLTDDLRAGVLQGKEAVRGALLDRVPGAESFPERELAGVIDSVLIGSTL